MIVLDTTVLLYAVGSGHALREPCRQLVEALRRGRVRGTTTPEVIQEFVHVRSRRRDRRENVSLARDFIRLLSPLLVVHAEHLERGLRLFDRHPALGGFDAVLGAVTMASGADALVSADRAFEGVRGLRWLEPASTELAEMIAG